MAIALLLQIERRDDGPLWAWTPAFLLVLASDLMLVAFLAAPSPPSRSGLRGICDPLR